MRFLVTVILAVLARCSVGARADSDPIVKRA